MRPSMILTKYCLSHLNSGDYRLSALGFHQAIVDAYYPLYRQGLPSTTLFIIVRSLYHPANNLQLTVSITGLTRAHSDSAAYQDVKELRYIISKNTMSVCMLNVWNYITVSKAVCKVYLRYEKESYIQKSDVPLSFLALFIILATEYKYYTKNIPYKVNRKVKYFLRCIIYVWEKWQKSFYTSIFDFFQYIFTGTLLMLASVLTDIRKTSIHSEMYDFISKKLFFFITY